MKQYRKLIKSYAILFLGFFFLAIGLVFTKRADLGMNAWGIFHQGLAIQTGLSFGVVTIIFGLIILFFTVLFFKIKIGIGTVLNVLIIGVIIDLIDYFFTFMPNTSFEKWGLLVLGIIIMTFGRALYISASLGEGPRDGLMIGLHVAFNIEIKYLKPIIEITVLIIGYLLGGTVGLGTLLIVLTSGYFVQTYFKLLHYNPKNKQQKGTS